MKKKIALFILMCILLLSFYSCANANKSTDVSNSSGLEDNADEAADTQIKTNTFPLVDYVEIHHNKEKFDGQNVRVAGCITNFSSSGNSLYFNDRLGGEDDGLGFEVKFPYTTGKNAVKGLYSVGDYIIIEGIYHSGTYPSLQEPTVISTGNDAHQCADVFMNVWVDQRSVLSDSLPVMDYMDIGENPSNYIGEYVRIAGKISSIGQNTVTSHKYFLFRSRETNYAILSISLKGCPQEMQDMCTEDQYAIISGKVISGAGRAEFIDCYVEEVGAAAQNAAETVDRDWLEAWTAKRASFIESCQLVSYDELSRNPDRYTNEKIYFSGTVLQTDIQYGENIILLDIGNREIVYVSYVGKQARDPEILENDKITLYGTYLGVKTYLTVLGTNNTVPYLNALYSNIN